MSLSTAATPYAAGDTSSGTGSGRYATMPTVEDGDSAILAVECAANLTPTLVPEGGWSNPWTLVRSVTASGKCLHIYKATDLSSTDSGKNTQITTPSSVKVARIIVPIRGGSEVDIVDAHTGKDGGTGNAETGSTPPLETTRPGCGALHVIMFRRNDGVAGDAFTSVTPNSGQGLVAEAAAYTGGPTSTSSLSALAVASRWTGYAEGATIPAAAFTSDKPGSYLAVTLSIRPGNVAPTAYAGPDVEVDAGDTAYITAASATDGDGTVVSTTWTLVSAPDGSAVDSSDIADETTLTPSLPTDVAGAYVLELEAEDDNGATHTDQMTIWAVTTEPRIRSITSAGGWTAVGAASIVAALEDDNPATYARSSANPVNDILTGELDPIPAGAKSWDLTLVNAVDSPVINALLYILNRETGTTVAIRAVNNITTTERPTTIELTPSENGLVLDSHKLNVRIVANTGS